VTFSSERKMFGQKSELAWHTSSFFI